MNLLDGFVFLRPAWLIALLPAALAALLLWRKVRASHGWKRWIDPDLLDALLVGGGSGRRLGPLPVLLVFWVVAIVALAGPSWRMQPSPFAEDQAVLMIALEASPSMGTRDVPPSRQERAAQKIADLLEEREGARHGLIAYAGSAHLVMPPTRDSSVLLEMLPDLSADLMPAPGEDSARALELAGFQLERADAAGAILFVGDGFRDPDLEALAAHRRAGGVPVHVLAIGDDPSIAGAAEAGGGSTFELSPDGSDVAEIARRVQQTARRPSQGEGEKREDGGYWLLIPLALISLHSFRRGWVLMSNDTMRMKAINQANQVSAPLP
jgi:Ca-activated chloride channel family protein